MKKNILILLALWTMLFAFSSCSDDDSDPKGGSTELVDDGFYISGAASPFTTLSTDCQLTPAFVENKSNATRSGLCEIYVALETGKVFNIVEVSGSNKYVYGTGVSSVDQANVTDEMTATIQKGTYAVGGTGYTVPSSGLYHVVVDKKTKAIYILPVLKWAILGGSTPKGWSDNDMTAGTFSKDSIVYKIENITLLKGNFKFRHSGGWKQTIVANTNADSVIKVNTNFGTSVSAPVSGGSDINLAATDAGIYTVKAKWTKGKGMSFSMAKTGTVVVATYPDSLFISGDATPYGWAVPATNSLAKMHKVAGGASNEGKFWKIAYLESGKGFKIAAKAWAEPNLGFSQIKKFDANGVTVVDKGGDLAVSESGIYAIVLNLRNDSVKLSVTPAKVYGIGDCFGSWDSNVAANLFTTDLTAKTLTSPALPTSANIRMYVSHSWIPDWWNAEFNIYNGKIEYRNDGGDQATVAGTAGQKIVLHFDDNTGSITTN